MWIQIAQAPPAPLATKEVVEKPAYALVNMQVAKEVPETNSGPVSSLILKNRKVVSICQRVKIPKKYFQKQIGCDRREP